MRGGAAWGGGLGGAVPDFRAGGGARLAVMARGADGARGGWRGCGGEGRRGGGLAVFGADGEDEVDEREQEVGEGDEEQGARTYAWLAQKLGGRFADDVDRVLGLRVGHGLCLEHKANLSQEDFFPGAVRWGAVPWWALAVAFCTSGWYMDTRDGFSAPHDCRVSGCVVARLLC